MIQVNGGGGYALVPFPENRKRIDIGDYYGDYSLIQKDVGWQPQVELEAGILDLLAFYRIHKEHYM